MYDVEDVWKAQEYLDEVLDDCGIQLDVDEFVVASTKDLHNVAVELNLDPEPEPFYARIVVEAENEDTRDLEHFPINIKFKVIQTLLYSTYKSEEQYETIHGDCFHCIDALTGEFINTKYGPQYCLTGLTETHSELDEDCDVDLDLCEYYL